MVRLQRNILRLCSCGKLTSRCRELDQLIDQIHEPNLLPPKYHNYAPDLVSSLKEEDTWSGINGLDQVAPSRPSISSMVSAPQMLKPLEPYFLVPPAKNVPPPRRLLRMKRFYIGLIIIIFALIGIVLATLLLLFGIPKFARKPPPQASSSGIKYPFMCAHQKTDTYFCRWQDSRLLLHQLVPISIWQRAIRSRELFTWTMHSPVLRIRLN